MREDDKYLSNEYLCLVQGKALLIAGEKKITVSAGQWLAADALHRELGVYSCEALSISRLLRVSKANLQVSSSTAQAYFYWFILDKFYLQSF